MQEAIINIMNQFGYIGVALLIMVENLFPPIPSEVILSFGGFMTTYTTMNPWGVIIAATVGSVAGALILYILGRVLSVERLEKLFDSKLGRLLHLKKEDVGMAEEWFSKRGRKAVFLCRFVPIVRSLISIPAGVAKMELGAFFSLTLVGTFIWNTALVYFGRFAGSAWESIAHYFDVYSTVALVVILAAIGIAGIIFIKKRFLDKTTGKTDEKAEEKTEEITGEETPKD